MKANEVRRGNLVDFEGRFFKIDVIAEVYPTLDTVEFGIGVVDWNNLKPIPLTEEWLLKFGFEKESIVFYHPKNNSLGIKIWNVHNDDVKFIVFWKNNVLNYYTNLHVNEIQNLYFALTGEELTLNEL